MGQPLQLGAQLITSIFSRDYVGAGLVSRLHGRLLRTYMHVAVYNDLLVIRSYSFQGGYSFRMYWKHIAVFSHDKAS